MDFNEIVTATGDQRIRAWSVEASLGFLQRYVPPFEEVVSLAKMIEDYVKTGESSIAIQAAINEGTIEGRFEVKQEVEEWFSEVDLDDLFVTKGWITPTGSTESPLIEG